MLEVEMQEECWFQKPSPVFESGNGSFGLLLKIRDQIGHICHGLPPWSATFSFPKALDSTCFSHPPSPTLFHTPHLCCRLSSRQDRTSGISFLLEILKDRPFSFKRFLQKSLWWTDRIRFLKAKTWKSYKDVRFSLPRILAPCLGTRKPTELFWTLLLPFRTELIRPSLSLHSS